MSSWYKESKSALSILRLPGWSTEEEELCTAWFLLIMCISALLKKNKTFKHCMEISKIQNKGKVFRWKTKKPLNMKTIVRDFVRCNPHDLLSEAALVTSMYLPICKLHIFVVCSFKILLYFIYWNTKYSHSQWEKNRKSLKSRKTF